MIYQDNIDLPDTCIGSPKIIYRNDNFLSSQDILHYQSLLKNHRWSLSNSATLDKILYISQSLYQHYAWDGQWDQVRWSDSTPPDWEILYGKICQHLPPHFLHWVDVKITGPLQSGAPVHRDKDPWSPGGDVNKFSKSISILCNLNTEWNNQWGGGLILYQTTKTRSGDIENIPYTVVPIIPGQLLIMENCFHSVELITEPSRSRVSLILHVLQYSKSS
jgi:hypothetical protein